MSRVEVERFNGHEDYVVVDAGDVPGELDAGDEIRKQDQRVPQDDPGFVSALQAFERARTSVGRARRQLTSFELGLHPDTRVLPSRQRDDPPGEPPRAPSESELREVISAMRSLASDAAAGTSPRLRAEAHLLVAWAESLITRDFASFFWTKIAAGTRAFQALREATQTDSSSAEAWCLYGVAVMSLGLSSGRGAAESAAGITVRDELARIIEGLAAHPGDVEATSVLEAALRLARREGIPMPELEERVRAALPGLREASPEQARRADAALRSTWRKLGGA